MNRFTALMAIVAVALTCLFLNFEKTKHAQDTADTIAAQHLEQVAASDTAEIQYVQITSDHSDEAVASTNEHHIRFIGNELWLDALRVVSTSNTLPDDTPQLQESTTSDDLARLFRGRHGRRGGGCSGGRCTV